MSSPSSSSSPSQENEASAEVGTLFLVGTPIGNLDDITLRAIHTLQAVDLVAAEDTRHTGQLLHHLNLTKRCISYHHHNRWQRLPELVQALQQGQSIALVSDAGMPTISDPGYELVRTCIEAGIPVMPIPGPSAVITALSSAGLPTDRFVFEGFLPPKGQQHQARLEALRHEARTIVLYEAPHRLQHTLASLAGVLGEDRLITVARELTKRYEEFWRGTLKEALVHYEQWPPRGEFTLVVAGRGDNTPIPSSDELKTELTCLLQQGMSRSQASRQLAKDYGLSRQEIYQLSLDL